MADNPFAKIFDTASGKAVQTSSITGDTPTHSLIFSELPDDGQETSMLQTGFDNEDPVSITAPAENSAQRWDRQADDLHGQIDNYLDASSERTKGYMHLYDSVFNEDFIRGDIGQSPDYQRRTHAADVLGMSGKQYQEAFGGRIDGRAKPSPMNTRSSLTPKAEWDAKFAGGQGVNRGSLTPEADWRKMFPMNAPPIQKGAITGPDHDQISQNIQYAV